jgi:diguanylate cyclase (GGDEF)-like protein
MARNARDRRISPAVNEINRTDAQHSSRFLDLKCTLVLSFPLSMVTDEGCTIAEASLSLNTAWVEASVERFNPQTKSPPSTVGFLLHAPGPIAPQTADRATQDDPKRHNWDQCPPEVPQSDPRGSFVGAKCGKQRARLEQLSTLGAPAIFQERKQFFRSHRTGVFTSRAVNEWWSATMMTFHRTFRWIFSAALLITALTARAKTAPLSKLSAIHSLTNEQASHALPVSFAGTVTYYVHGNVDLFVQDGSDAIYVETTPGQTLVPGDRVLVVGTTSASFRPEIKAQKVILRGHGEPPRPAPAEFRQLIRAELDCQRATVRGFVRSANVVNDAGISTLYLQLQMKGGTVDAQMPHTGPIDLTSLLDSEVELTGAVAGRFDRKMQMTGVLIEVPSPSDMKVIRRAFLAPKDLPITPMDQILRGYEVQNSTHRIKVTGTITYYEPGSMLVLQSGDKSLLVTTQFEQPARIGDLATVTGFPDVQNGSLVLTGGAINDTNSASRVAPIRSSSDVLASGERALDLVSIDGQLLTAVREPAQDEYLFVSNGHLFKAILQHPKHFNAVLKPMLEIPAGSSMRIVGVCRVSAAEQSQEPTAFDILLRSPEDLTLVAGPSLLNVRNLTCLVGALLAIMLVIGTLAWRTERRGRTHIARLARIEQMRSRVLEHLNGSTSLLDLVDEATEIVSFRLNGAACWCELTDGRQRGTRPRQFTGLRIVEQQILSRSGAKLGLLCAAFHARTRPARIETDALSSAGGLIALAIENRRLYSDLQHRSEFDLLTELHNRFSLEKRLGGMIEEAKAEKSRFGMIYIDLDGFKLINDHYGHQIGDRYLQQVTLRMRHQLRPNDVMARVGGDEFAVLIQDAATHEDIHSVVARLDGCFSNPFRIDANLIHGAASFGVALFPVDGNTQDSLLNSADAAMYVAKHQRRALQSNHDDADIEFTR